MNKVLCTIGYAFMGWVIFLTYLTCMALFLGIDSLNFTGYINDLGLARIVLMTFPLGWVGKSFCKYMVRE